MDQTHGEALRQWREGQHLSREELGSMVQASASTVANWELGRNRPRGAALAALEKLIQRGVVKPASTPLSKDEGWILDKIVEVGGYKDRLDALAAFMCEEMRKK
jgi:transcriptional regulator with XRE-family HTH domain